jgi:tRNA G37 N-methylase Trm5
MNLPHSVFDFVSTAMSNIKHEGTIHYYEVLGDDRIRRRLEDIENLSEEHGMRVKLIGETEVHTYSPDSSLYCLDLRIEKGE